MDSGDDPSQEQVPAEEAGSWSDTFPLVLDLQAEELQIWHEEALLEEDFVELQESLEERADAATESERSALENLFAEAASARQRAMSLFLERLGAARDQGTYRDPRGRLEDIQVRRQKIIDRVVDPSLGRKDSEETQPNEPN